MKHFSNGIAPMYENYGPVIPGRKKTSNVPVFIKKRLAEYPIPERLLECEASELLDQVFYSSFSTKYSNI